MSETTITDAAVGGAFPQIAAVGLGGLLVRFAGPRLAASDLARAEEDPLLPVRLREGGRLADIAPTMLEMMGLPKPD
ncbi:MAG: hypothetical protein ACO3VR_05300, partial [Lutimaribacter sp.]